MLSEEIPRSDRERRREGKETWLKAKSQMVGAEDTVYPNLTVLIKK